MRGQAKALAAAEAEAEAAEAEAKPTSATQRCQKRKSIGVSVLETPKRQLETPFRLPALRRSIRRLNTVCRRLRYLCRGLKRNRGAAAATTSRAGTTSAVGVGWNARGIKMRRTKIDPRDSDGANISKI